MNLKRGRSAHIKTNMFTKMNQLKFLNEKQEIQIIDIRRMNTIGYAIDFKTDGKCRRN